MRLTAIPSHRFQTRVTESTSAARTAEGDTLRFSAEATRAFLGRSAVRVGRITPEEFIEKVRAAKKEMIDAPSFDVVFQERVLADPAMARAFAGYLELVRAGSVQVSAEKKSAAEVVFNRMQVVAFLEQMESKLSELIARREDAPVDLVQLGLKLIQRNGDIQETVSTPLMTAATAREMAGMNSLKPSERAPFLERLAKAAVQELAPREKRTPELRSAALQHLQYALAKSLELGVGKSLIANYFPEAQRIAAELDGGTGAFTIATNAIFLRSKDPEVKKHGEERLLDIAKAIVEERRGRDPQRANNGPENEAFKALGRAACESPRLFRHLPEWIEAITNGGAPTSEEKPVYTPDAGELATRGECLRGFLWNLQFVFPSFEDDEARQAHKVLCEQGLDLVLQSIASDQGQNISFLAGHLARHPELIGKATETLLSAEFITDAAQRADASAAVVCALLENGQYEQAYQLFNGTTLSEMTDANSAKRQTKIFARATAAAIDSKMAMECSEPVKEWLATAHLRAVEVALNPGGPALAELRELAETLARDGFTLDAQSAVDFVGKVEAALPALGNSTTETSNQGQGLQQRAPRIGWIAPALVNLLVKHADDDGCMQKAEALIKQVRLDNTRGDAYQMPGLQTSQVRNVLDLMSICSRVERLSGHVVQLAEDFVANFVDFRVQHKQDSKLPVLASYIPGLGKFVDKDKLARLRPPADDAQLTRTALALGGDVETTAYARELIADFVQRMLAVEVKDLQDADRVNMLFAEAAVRCSVPNLISEKAAVGLIKAFQQSKAPKEALVLVKTYMPQEIIKTVLEQVSSAEIRDFLEGRTRQSKNDTSRPEAGEGIPVAVVAAGARAPTENV